MLSGMRGDEEHPNLAQEVAITPFSDAAHDAADVTLRTPLGGQIPDGERRQLGFSCASA